MKVSYRRKTRYNSEKHISCVETYAEKNKKENVMGPRMKFEKLYLKDSTTPKEIKSAVSEFLKENSGYTVEMVMEWAKEIIEKRLRMNPNKSNKLDTEIKEDER